MGILLSVVVVLSSVVEEDVLLFLAHEITVRLKRKRERIMSRCFIKFPFSELGEPNIYHDLGVFYKNWEDCGGESDL